VRSCGGVVEPVKLEGLGGLGKRGEALWSGGRERSGRRLRHVVGHVVRHALRHVVGHALRHAWHVHVEGRGRHVELHVVREHVVREHVVHHIVVEVVKVGVVVAWHLRRVAGEVVHLSHRIRREGGRVGEVLCVISKAKGVKWCKGCVVKRTGCKSRYW